MNTAVGLTNVFVYFTRKGGGFGGGGDPPQPPPQQALRRTAITGWRPLEDEANVFTEPQTWKKRALGIVKTHKRALVALTFSLKHHALFSYLLYVLLDAESQERLHHA